MRSSSRKLPDDLDSVALDVVQGDKELPGDLSAEVKQHFVRYLAAAIEGNLVRWVHDEIFTWLGFAYLVTEQEGVIVEIAKLCKVTDNDEEVSQMVLAAQIEVQRKNAPADWGTW